MKKNFGVNTCKACGSKFKPLGPGAKYCSLQCRFGKTHCDVCGILFQKTSPNRRVCDKCQITPQDAVEQVFTAIHGFYPTPDKKPPKTIKNGKCGHCGAPTQRKKPPVTTWKAFCSPKCHKTYRKGFFAANNICVCCESKPVEDGKRTCIACRQRNSKSPLRTPPPPTPIESTDKWRIEQALKYPFSFGYPLKPAPEWATRPMDESLVNNETKVPFEFPCKNGLTPRQLLAKGVKVRTQMDRMRGIIR